MPKKKKKAEKAKNVRGYRQRTAKEWAELLTEYIQWEPEDKASHIKAFAKLKGIKTSGGFTNRVAREGWLRKRNEFWAAHEETRRQESARRLTEKAIVADEADFDLATDVSDLTRQTIDRAKEAKDKQGRPAAVKPSGLVNLSATIVNTQRVRRIASGKGIPGEGGTTNVNVNIGDQGDPYAPIRAQFAAAKAAGINVQEEMRIYLQSIVDEVFQDGTIVHITNPKQKALTK